MFHHNILHWLDTSLFTAYPPLSATTRRPLRPNLIENHDVALERYRRALARKVTLEQVIGPGWRAFVKRPRLVAWMSSHCPTISKREEYVRELAKYIPVDT